MDLTRKVQSWFLLFLLVVLALALVLIAATSRAPGSREAVTVAAVVALAALSVYRHRQLPHSVACDVGAAGLVVLIGTGMPDHLTHVFGLAFVHLFLRTLDHDAVRVAFNGALHPAAYFATVALVDDAEALVQVSTLTNLAGFVFVAGLMHTLAGSFAGQERLHHEIVYHATHDPLTGLANRTLFTDRIGQALYRSRRHGTRTGLVFIDLDDFKSANDRYGHGIGDQLLAEWGQRLAGCLRGSDTAARLGGDEFAVILEDVHTLEQARTAGDRIRAHLEQPYIVGDHTIRLTASFGVALSSADATPDQLLDHADTAMFSAKGAPRQDAATTRDSSR